MAELIDRKAVEEVVERHFRYRLDNDRVDAVIAAIRALPALAGDGGEAERPAYAAALDRIAGRHRLVLQKIEAIGRDYSHGGIDGAAAIQRIDDIVALALYGPDTPVARAALGEQG